MEDWPDETIKTGVDVVEAVNPRLVERAMDAMVPAMR